MSVVELEPHKLTKQDIEWFKFVQGLKPWEAHRLHVIGELEQYDLWVGGESTLLDVKVACAGACMCVSCRNTITSKKKSSEKNDQGEGVPV